LRSCSPAHTEIIQDDGMPQAINELFINKLPYKTTEADIFEAFSKFGDILHIEIVKQESGVPAGSGFIEFADTADAQEALWSTGLEILGSKIQVRLATDGDDELKKVKAGCARSRSEEERSEAAKIRGVGGVIEILEDKYGCRKGQQLRVVGEKGGCWTLQHKSKSGKQVDKGHLGWGWKWV